MEKQNRPVGIHIRLHQGLQDVIETIEQLKVSIAQSFLIMESNAYVPLSDRVINDFVHAKKTYDFLYFVHAAYWSGLTDSKSKVFASLQKEVELSQDLSADGIVIHPGATRSGLSKQDAILYVAESVNLLNQSYPNMTLLLENGPHAGRSFGGDLLDFVLLMEHVEIKERIAFCIDTAHAFVYGYNIANEFDRNDFLQILDQELGADNIKLLHFNDSKDACGSYIDKHETPGEGMIGKKALQDIMNHTIFKDVPIIMECSKDCAIDAAVIQEVASWEV